MNQPIAKWSPTTYLTRVLGIRRDEFAPVAWSFAYFFCLLSAYYMLRPVREAMAIVGGTENIPWLFTGTFIVMIMATPVFGWVASRFPRKTFLPWVYYFFICNIMIFFAVFSYSDTHELNQVWIARSFFVWLSVFNLFVVSVFWSFMADIYSKEQCRRLFGVITAGGSTGAFLGGIITGLLVVPIGFKNLLPMSAGLLLVAVFCVYRLRRWTALREKGASQNDIETDTALGGSALEGIRRVFTSPYFSAIAMALVLANFLGGVMYFYMAEMVSLEYPTTDEQTRVFALLNTLTTAFSFVGQLLVVRHSVRRFGVGTTLAVMPLIAVIGFAVLAINPTFIVLAALQVFMRSVGFGLTKPTSDMLYSVVSPEARYKAKNFIDTAVYRGADVASIWTIKVMSVIGMGLGAVSLICVPLAIAWASLSLWIGRQYDSRDQQRVQNQTESVKPS
jgi:AAA family ATP:ADP antiporter